MATDEECVDYARECVRLAGQTEDHDLQAKLLDLARQWMAAAMHEAKAPEPKTKAFEGDHC
jgi:hypothetical protein